MVLESRPYHLYFQIILDHDIAVILEYPPDSYFFWWDILDESTIRLKIDVRLRIYLNNALNASLLQIWPVTKSISHLDHIFIGVIFMSFHWLPERGSWSWRYKTFISTMVHMCNLRSLVFSVRYRLIDLLIDFFLFCHFFSIHQLFYTHGYLHWSRR